MPAPPSLRGAKRRGNLGSTERPFLPPPNPHATQWEGRALSRPRLRRSHAIGRQASPSYRRNRDLFGEFVCRDASVGRLKLEGKLPARVASLLEGEDARLTRDCRVTRYAHSSQRRTGGRDCRPSRLWDPPSPLSVRSMTENPPRTSRLRGEQISDKTSVSFVPLW